MAIDSKVVTGGTAAALLGIYADLAYNTYSATNSSPQTTELFAGDRKESLMKYVYFGHVQAIGIGAIGSLISKSWWPIIGAVGVGAIMHGMYTHAVSAGAGQAPPANATVPSQQVPDVGW